jgi:hypothetical protein
LELTRGRFLSRLLDSIVLRRYGGPINASNISGAGRGSESEVSKLRVVRGCDGHNVLPWPRHLRCFRTVLPVLLAWSFLSAVAADRDVRSVDAIPIISGAVLADRFDQQEVDRRIWHRPDWLENHNPYLAVEPEHGWLHLSGISRASGEHQYVGLISSNFRETDVVLAARMRIRSAFDKDGRIQHFVHLCSGDWPDFFTEVVFGKIRSGPPVWSIGYVNRVFDYQGHSEYLQPVVPATGREASEWHEVVIDHDGVTGETRNYLVIDGFRRPVGPVVRIPFHHTHVELKVDVNATEAQVAMEVGDVRLYLRPERYPAIVVVNSQIVDSHSEPAIDGLRVRLVASPSGRTLGEAITDESGQAKISLVPDLTYPIEAQIEVSDLRGLVLKARIPSAGVTGLYPGDVWAVRFPRRPLSQ